MTLREKIEVMEAFERGEEIESSGIGINNWRKSNNPTWDWFSFEYRIKQKPKQTVVIEKWLCKSLTRGKEYFFEICTNDIDSYFYDWNDSAAQKVKLLGTYEEGLP